MTESGKFPIYMDNKLYLLQFEETEEAKQFKTKLIELYGHSVHYICDTNDDDITEVKDKIYHKVCEEFEDRVDHDWDNTGYYLKLAHDTVYIHCIIPSWQDVEGKNYAHFTVIPYIVYYINKIFMSNYVDLENRFLSRAFKLFNTKDTALSEEERLEMIDTYFSLLKIKDASSYFVPRIQCNFDIEEFRQQDVLATLQGEEKFDIHYKTVYEENISSTLIQQQLLTYFLQEHPEYGRVADHGIELLYFTDEDEIHAKNNEKYLSQFPKFKEKLYNEFVEKEKDKIYKKVKEEEHK